MRTTILFMTLSTAVAVSGCSKSGPQAHELPRYRDAVIVVTDLLRNEHNPFDVYSFGDTEQPHWRDSKPSGAVSGAPFHFRVQWQYMGTTEHADIYEINLMSKDIPGTPPLVTVHIGYSGNPMIAYENESVRIMMKPPKKK